MRLRRFLAGFLAAIMVAGLFPAEAYAGGGTAGSAVVDKDGVVEQEDGAAASWDGDTLIAGLEKDSAGGKDSAAAPDGIDFSSRRVLVGTDDPSVLRDTEDMLEAYAGGVYLLGYDTEREAAEAYAYYSGIADFAEADIPMYIASGDVPDGAGNGTASAGEALYDIALIDTGVPEGAAAMHSVTGDSGVDDNGHGTAMFGAIRSVDGSLSVLSIKAFDSHGVGFLSDVYEAVLYAIDHGVSVIAMPFAAETASSGAVLAHAIAMAEEAGVIIVGAAGNGGTNVDKYLPGRLDGVYIAGACDGEGDRLPASNYGENIFRNVAARSTSEAAAKLAALIAAYGLDGVDGSIAFEPDRAFAGYEEHADLVEAAASDDHRLLAEDALSPATLEAIAAIDGDGGPAAGPEGQEDPEAERDWSVPPKQDPVTADGTTIEHVYLRWLSRSTGAEAPAYFGLLDLKPASEDVGNQQFQIDFALSGQEAYEPGAVEVVLPARLWLDRYGKEPGYLTLSVPEDPAEGVEFVWKRLGGNIVVTNAKTLAPASKVMIQGTFRGVIAPDMIDDTYSDEYGGFFATVNVRTSGDGTLAMDSNVIRAHIDTEAHVAYAAKTAYNATKKSYDIWWGRKPDGLPAALFDVLGNLGLSTDPADYGFVRWYVDGTAAGSQPFYMHVSDTIYGYDPGTGSEPEYGGIMLGVSGSDEGTVPSEDGRTVRARLYAGYSTAAKPAYVWTAYPVGSLPADREIDIHNRQIVSVEGQDDHAVTTAAAAGSVRTKAPAEYRFVKHWLDNDDANGVRPKSMTLRIYRSEYSNTAPWKTVTLTAGGSSTSCRP